MIVVCVKDVYYNNNRNCCSFFVTFLMVKINLIIAENDQLYLWHLYPIIRWSRWHTHARIVPLNSFATYSVFEVLRGEARVMEGLRSLLIETQFIHDILKLNVQPSDSDYAVDIRSPAISVRIHMITHTSLITNCQMLQQMRTYPK